MRTAVVLGASVAGLLAARVLSDHAERVVIVEPDDLTAAGHAGPGGTTEGPGGGGVASGPRPGVPQGVQLHVLMAMGRTQLDRWLPGMSDELLGGGAVFCAGERVHQYTDGVRRPLIPGHDLISSTRPFLEERVRRRVLGLPNVEVARGRADGLRFTANTVDQRVCGAFYLPTDTPASDDDGFAAGSARTRRVCLAADLVVDATGRGTRIGTWLEKAGWQPPPVERIAIDLGYATALLRRGPELPDVAVTTAMATPAPDGSPQPDSAAVAEVEGGRWMMVLAGYAARRPTRDPREFVERCAAIPAGPVREIATGCEILGDVVCHRVPDSRRREFTRLSRFPAGLVVVGDAAASFNPVYGQGMTSAALHASCLSAYLRSGGRVDEPARDFFVRQRVVVDAAWQLSAIGDLAQPHVDGPYPAGFRAAQWYSARLGRACALDPEVYRRFLDVVNMRERPELLTRPGTALRVARALLAADRG
ncbi:hypothetical protein ABZ832_22955 [Streptantibioticus parmotrematis]|uniref:hypothetical protein n=1 Tax=Streptantibioticus parmotrematis TaxID=2873249 RepID=UPI0033DF5DFC